MIVVKLSQKAINKALEVLNAGGVVIFPTDTVYGLVCDAENIKAVEKIYKIKKRPKSKPLGFFVKNLKAAKELAEISLEQEKILKTHWPGKFIFILRPSVIPAKAGIQSKCKKTVGLRIPDYKPLNLLLKKISKPLAQTSVNISGQPELNKIGEIIKIFENKKSQPDLIINAGDLPEAKPSKVIDLSTDKIKILRK